jgi:predicted dinucleotide-binding enzyme
VKIAVIGSGKIGSTAARLFLEADHDVAIANRHGPDSLAAVVAELGPRASAAPLEDAARASELALPTIPFGAYGQLPAPAFAGKVVIDANNYYPGRDGQIPKLDRGHSTSTELTARHLTDATLVKSFNTVYYRTLASAGDVAKPEEERLALCLASDDDDATRIVS